MGEVTIRLHLEPLDDGGFVATSPDVPGLVAEGRTAVEATEIARDVARKIADSSIEHGMTVPPVMLPLAGVPRPLDVVIPVGVD